jgi:hypothetical protein
MSKGKWPHEASDQDPGNAAGDLIGEIHVPDELSQ